MRRLALFCLFLLSAIGASAQNNPVPFLSQPLTPTSVVPGHPAFTLKVRGAGFRSGAAVKWNGSPRPTTVVSQNEVDAAISATDVAHRNIAAITVSNPAPGGGRSNLAYFPVGPAIGALAFARQDTLVDSPLRGNATPAGSVVADFNNDGKLDLVVGWATDERSVIQVFPGNGDGTFARAVETEVPFTVTSFVTGDFNGDGNVDIALAYAYYCGGYCNFTPFLYILLGRGDGHFDLAPDGGMILGEPLVAADFNGDGKLDLITTSSDHSFDGWGQSVALGNGDGTFGTPTPLASQEFYSVPSVGDFNSDGVLDVALTPCWYSCDPGVDVFYGIGDGNFQVPVDYLTPDRVSWAVAGDVNGDGILDIATGVGGDVLLGDGHGAFEVSKGDNFSGSSDVRLVDVNNDQKLDLLGEAGNGFSVSLGNGDGTFLAPQSWSSGELHVGPIVVGFPDDGRLAVIDVNTEALSGEWVISVFRQTTLSVSPTFFDFESERVGRQSAPQAFTLSNVGASPVNVTAIRLLGSVDSYLENNNCVGNLAAGASCAITVAFAPATVGTLPLKIEINYQGTTGSPQSIELTGIGSPTDRTR